MSNRRSLSFGGLPAAARGRARGGRRGRVGAVSVLEMGFDGGVAGGDLRLTGVEELEILLQDEEVLRAIVAGQRGDDLGLRTRGSEGRDAGRAAAGSRWPATMSRRMRSPVTPVISLTTSGSCRFICTSAFCIRWM